MKFEKSCMKAAVVMGGTSLEHDISMKSGSNISRAVLKGNHHVFPLVITRENLWSFPDRLITCEEELE
ncbi:MAG: hypothetical protein PF689_09980, partial [Deltaproteobacteria bacterium]|nr:hypothetical protein [Deltaproteobacteria bacterium]